MKLLKWGCLSFAILVGVVVPIVEWIGVGPSRDFYCGLRAAPLLAKISIFAILGMLAYGFIGLGLIADILTPKIGVKSRLGFIGIGVLVGAVTYGILIGLGRTDCMTEDERATALAIFDGYIELAEATK
jgi:hypothetical protein